MVNKMNILKFFGLSNIRTIRNENLDRLYEIKKKEQESNLLILYKTLKGEEDEKLIKYKEKTMKQITDLALACAKDSADYEHVFHSSKEIKTTEIAKLEAKIDGYKEFLNDKSITNFYKTLLDGKDGEIARLNKIISELIEVVNCLNSPSTKNNTSTKKNS